MKEWIGSPCRLTVISDGKKLFYTVREVLSVSDSHITFIDRFNEVYTFNRTHIDEIQPYKAEKQA